MRIATLIFTALLICGCRADDTFFTPQEAEVMRIELLSQEGKYEEIFDSLGSEYRTLVEKHRFAETSRRIRWKMTKTQIGTVNAGADASYAPIRSETIRGRQTSIIDSVIFFVRENGKWRLWNLPFATPDLPDRPSGSLPSLDPKS